MNKQIKEPKEPSTSVSPKSRQTKTKSRQGTKKVQEISLNVLIQSLQTTQQPLTVLSEILHSIILNPPSNSIYNTLLSSFHRLTTPITTPPSNIIIMNTQYIVAILAVISLHQPTVIDLLTPLNHYALLFPQLLTPTKIEESSTSLLSMLTSETPSSIATSIHSELKTLFALPSLPLVIPYLTLLILSHMNVIVSLPKLPHCDNEKDLLLFLPLYTTVLARGSTQPLPVVDDLMTPITLCLNHLPSTLQPLTEILAAIMNYSNRITQDTFLTIPIMNVLTKIHQNMFSSDDWFDIRVLLLSIAANALYELKKTAIALVKSNLLEEYCQEFGHLGDTKEDKIMKGYLAVVICGFVFVDQECAKRVQLEWEELLGLLEEFAAFQQNCGAMDETSQRRLIDAMEVIEKIVDTKTASTFEIPVKRKSSSLKSKGIDLPQEDNGKEEILKESRMSFDSLSLNDIDCY
ncbi:hypothetical protein KM1_074260 [Entamoeba histolytica HM-3:IMSS]|uniref:Uncharacterized protein n=2 Tax=Entamoeba histolytica TaxID=5759 RepID=N9UWP6_ENTH1|nr:hypothetical protein KM1_074260 [Entamoeba histolytica HM-3:IMSS]ENY65167.1 hypothetical protein EHI7A_035430 [Entamoeba histolytica HM-1:IMSS-A]